MREDPRHDVIMMHRMVDRLNRYRDAYYNNNESLVTDEQYDRLFDELQQLEKRTGVVLSNSPTVTVGYEVVSQLKKVTHDHPMLSLAKTKDMSEVIRWLNGQLGMVMAKMDGLTCSLKYVDGKLVSAETRGDGAVGEDITHNISVVRNVPLTINAPGEVVIDGELIITSSDFEELKEKFVDNKGKKYKNARNLAAGSVRLLDSKQCAQRRVRFIAWKLVRGIDVTYMSEGLIELENLGFVVCPFYPLTGSAHDAQECVDNIQEICKSVEFPIDGCVFSLDDIKELQDRGSTSHHLKGQMAFKFYDDLYDTVIRDIDWTMGKTGTLTPTAMFDTVEIDGTEVSRASLHNLTIMRELNVRKDCSARVFKANMIIPQVSSVDDDGVADFDIPAVCPVCGAETEVISNEGTEILCCKNSNCKGKLLGKICAFAGKSGLDIIGLGEGKVQQLIDLGYIKNFEDVFNLSDYKYELFLLEGWGVSSVVKLLNSIEASKECKLENFISALSIPDVGLATAKTICEYFDNSIDQLTYAFNMRFAWDTIPGFGEIMSQKINNWYAQNERMFSRLVSYMHFQAVENSPVVSTNSPISGKTFCITGTFDRPRSELKKEIESFGGISVDSVTKKTDVLFVGSKAGSKLKKAQELGIVIITEELMDAYLGGVVVK